MNIYIYTCMVYITLGILSCIIESNLVHATVFNFKLATQKEGLTYTYVYT